jgi:glycerophosphoryl diester phosphodiesterase
MVPRLAATSAVSVLVLGATLAACRGHRRRTGRLRIIAHRGVHQTFERAGVTGDTCTATRVEPIRHRFIENTIPAIEAAFAAGATMVEIDVHHTADGQVVVFHDWTLECRTNGRGVTQEQTLAYLRSLDVGYGYTADGGRTYPLRGAGVGLMPTLGEVLSRFPDREFVLNQKSSSRVTVDALARVLAPLPSEGLRRLHYWGVRGEELAVAVPGMGRALASGRRMKTCGLAILQGAGDEPLPSPCRDIILVLPEWSTRLLADWPEPFLSRAAASGSPVVIADVDDPATAARLTTLPLWGIMTDRIELIGPALTRDP